MQILGILGGIASGKSQVARLLADAGAGVLDADTAGHQALFLADVKEAAGSRWGQGIFDPRGNIDRGRLAEIVFAPPPEGPVERKYLEQLTHGHIGQIVAGQAERLAAGGCPLAVLDAPLLLEAGWDRLCSTLVFVQAPRDVRLARALERGWTAEEFAAREQAQLPVEEKRARADHLLANAGDLEQTRSEVLRLWADLIGSGS